MMPPTLQFHPSGMTFIATDAGRVSESADRNFQSLVAGRMTANPSFVVVGEDAADPADQDPIPFERSSRATVDSAELFMLNEQDLISLGGSALHAPTTSGETAASPARA